jgi:hypothetical protein
MGMIWGDSCPEARMVRRSRLDRGDWVRLRGRQSAYSSATCGDSCPEARITWPVSTSLVAVDLSRGNGWAPKNGLPTSLNDEELVAVSQLAELQSNFTSASTGG